MRSIKSFLGTTFAVFMFTLAHGAVRTWDGSSTGNWMTPANWSTGVAPVSGDTLVFSIPAGRTTNNFPANTIFTLRLTSASNEMYGNTILLNGLYTDNNPPLNDRNATNVINLDLVLNQNIVHESLNNGCWIKGDINLNGRTLTASNNASGPIYYAGVISGNGNLVKRGADDLTLLGGSANTYVGTMTVDQGTLHLRKRSTITGFGLTSVPGPLVIGDGSGTDTVIHEASAQIGNVTVTINRSGTLDLSDFNDTIGSLILSNGVVATGNGTLTLSSNLTVLTSSTNASFTGGLSLSASASHTFDIQTGASFNLAASLGGSGDWTKTGFGTLILSSSNTFSGTATINAGDIEVRHPFALGSTNGPTIVNNGWLLNLRSVAVGFEALTLNSNSVLQSFGTSSWAGLVMLDGTGANSPRLTAGTANSELILSGVLTGSGGFAAAGTVRLGGSASNSYAGATIVEGGVLFLDKTANVTAIPGRLLIGDQFGSVTSAVVRLLQPGQISNTSTNIIFEDGLLNLDGQNDTVGRLELFGGRIQTGTGTLTMNGDMSVEVSSLTALIQGNLSFGNANRSFMVADNAVEPDLDLRANLLSSGAIGGWTKGGPGSAFLSGTNTYSGMTLITNGMVQLNTSLALGDGTETLVSANGSLYLNGVSLQNELLYLESSGAPGYAALDATNASSWGGPIVLQTDSTIGAKTNSTLTLSGDISGFAGFTKTGEGKVTLSGSLDNTYEGTTTVLQGTLELNKPAGVIAVPTNITVVTVFGFGPAQLLLLSNREISDGATVDVYGPGALFNLNNHDQTIGALTGNGGVDLGSGTLTIRPQADATFDGSISGTGGLTFAGPAEFRLGGLCTYSGPTVVSDGTLLVGGFLTNSAIQVLPPASLGVWGRVGNVVSSGTTFAGLYNYGLSGELFTARALNLNGGKLSFDLITTLGSHDRLSANSLAISNTALEVFAFPGFAPPGASYTIVTNLGAGPIAGTFANMPEGGILKSTNSAWLVSYQGGDGNDLVLTRVRVGAPPATINSLVPLGNGSFRLEADGAARSAYGIETSTNLVQWQHIGGVAAGSDGSIQFILPAVSDPMRFYQVLSEQ